MYRLFKVLSRWSLKRISVVFLLIILSCVAYNLDVIGDIIKIEHNHKGNRIVSEKDLDIPKHNLEMINKYLTETPFSNTIAFVGVYKFIPEGGVYNYQVRVLATSYRGNVGKNFIHEGGLEWMPLWSTHKAMAYIFNKQPVTLKIGGNPLSLCIEGSNEEDKSTSLNLGLLENLGITQIQLYPIVSKEITVGYVAVYSTDRGDYSLVESQLSSHIASYMVKA